MKVFRKIILILLTIIVMFFLYITISFAYQKIVLSDEAKKYSKLKKEYFVFKKARNIIIEELYSFGIVTIGNNRKSVKIFGIDGERYNIKISYVNCYSKKQIVITDIKFDEDVQKVIYAIEKQKN